MALSDMRSSRLDWLSYRRRSAARSRRSRWRRDCSHACRKKEPPLALRPAQSSRCAVGIAGAQVPIATRPCAAALSTAALKSARSPANARYRSPVQRSIAIHRMVTAPFANRFVCWGRERCLGLWFTATIMTLTRRNLLIGAAGLGAMAYTADVEEPILTDDGLYKQPWFLESSLTFRRPRRCAHGRGQALSGSCGSSEAAPIARRPISSISGKTALPTT